MNSKEFDWNAFLKQIDIDYSQAVCLFNCCYSNEKTFAYGLEMNLKQV